MATFQPQTPFAGKKRSANEFEHYHEELNVSTREPKRFRTQPSTDTSQPPSLSAGNKRSANEFEHDNEQLTASTREPKRLRTQYSAEANSHPAYGDSSDELNRTEQRSEAPRLNLSTPRQAPRPASPIRPHSGDNASQQYQSEEDTEAMIEPLTEQAIPELESLAWVELKKQRKIICRDFESPKSRGAVEHMRDFWGRQAQELEVSFLAQSGLDEEDITSPKGSMWKLLLRHNELLKKACYRQYPSPEDRGSHECDCHRDIVERNVLYLQLTYLRNWTAEWQKEFATDNDQPHSGEDSQGGEIRDGASKAFVNAQDGPWSPHRAHAPRTQGPPVQKPLETDSQRTVHDQPHQPAGSETPNGQDFRNLRPQTQHMQAQNPQATHNAFHGQRAMSVHQPSRQGYQHGQQVGNANTPQVYSEQIGTGYGSAQGTHIPHGSGQTNGVSNFAAAPGNLHPSSVNGISIAVNVQPPRPSTAHHVQTFANVGHQPAAQNSKSQPGRRPRGAPRKHMFLGAPHRNTPLPQSALSDDDEILNRFPEHLSHPVIMQRFVESSTTRSGGYQTGDMVKALLQHANARDTVGITEEQRKENIRRWVVKERDACNKKLKGGHDLSSVPASMIATPSAVQPSLQASPSLLGMSMSLQSLQTPLTMVPPMGSHAAANPSPVPQFGLLADSSTTASAWTPVPFVAPATSTPLNTYGYSQYTNDPILPNLGLEQGGSDTFGIDMEAGATAAVDALNEANVWNITGMSEADLQTDGMIRDLERIAAGEDASQSAGFEYKPVFEEMFLNTRWDLFDGI